MSRRDTGSPRRDPLRQLERGGGAIWAFKRGSGSRIELRYAGVRDGHAEIHGRLWPEGVIAGDKPVPIDELNRLGRHLEDDEWVQRWVIRSDLDRSAMGQAVADTSLLAALHDERPDAYRLTYRPPGEEDAGFGQIGCLFAGPSCLVGDVVGAVLALVRDDRLPLIETFIFAGVFSLGVGFVVFGTVFPRLIAMVPGLRARATDTTAWLMVVVPGLVALFVWLFAPGLGLRDGDQLLVWSAALVVAFVLLPFVPVVAVMIRGRRR